MRSPSPATLTAMKNASPRIFRRAALLALAALLLPACTTTRTEDGVTIEKENRYNPLDYIPWL